MKEVATTRCSSRTGQAVRCVGGLEVGGREVEGRDVQGKEHERRREGTRPGRARPPEPPDPNARASNARGGWRIQGNTSPPRGGGCHATIWIIELSNTAD